MSSSSIANQRVESAAYDATEVGVDCGLVLIPIVRPATATPAHVSGTSTTLSVLGDDVLGEALLRYTWEVVLSPRGAQVSFSENASNSAKNTTATFSQPGSYTFMCTITNGLFSIVSGVEVLVEEAAAQLAA